MPKFVDFKIHGFSGMSAWIAIVALDDQGRLWERVSKDGKWAWSPLPPHPGE